MTPTSAGDPGAIAPQPAALVTIQPEKEGYSRVVSVSMPGDQPAHTSPSTPTPHHYKEEGRGDEPQDLTPMQVIIHFLVIYTIYYYIYY